MITLSPSILSADFANLGAHCRTVLDAGADMLLMPEDFQSAYNGVLSAVENGTVTEERIDESVCRILEVKASMKGAENDN